MSVRHRTVEDPDDHGTAAATGGYRVIDVPVTGGTLRAGQWRPDAAGPAVLAAHGVTANHLAFSWIAERLPHRLIAPDLRGRGRSGTLPGPAGMAAHTADLLAVLDHLGIERAVLLGHSMGGFVMAAFAAAHPDRVAGVVLLDGGLPLPPAPPGLGPQETLAVIIGPAAQRLQMTFADLPAYLEYWRPHPALASAWSPGIERYLAYDLVGEPPQCRSSVSLDAVRDDSIDLLDVAAVAARVDAVPAGSLFLRAARGMLDEPGGLYPPDLTAEHRGRWPDMRFDDIDANHYTLVMSPDGAAAVARAIAALVDAG